MTRERIMTCVAAILTTLLETDGGPESSVYLALGADLQNWMDLRGLMIQSDLIRVDGNHWVTLTEKGRQTAEECNAVLAGAKR